MKLMYRGIGYHYNPAVNFNKPKQTKALGAVLRYRGVAYQVQPATEAAVTEAVATPVLPAQATLTYRGMTYQVKPIVQLQPVQAAQTQAQAVATPTLSIEAQARVLTVNHHRQIKRREQSMLSRLGQWVGLPVTDSLFWNHIGGESHPSFRATYDRSTATMS